MLRLAASLDQGSEHPLAHAIVQGARARGLVLDSAEGFASDRGIGVRGSVGGKALALGNGALMAQLGDTEALKAQAEALRAEGASVMHLAVDGKLAGLLAVSDPIKASTAQALAQLKASGLRVIMATGDGLTTAQSVAAKLRIDEVHGEVKPADKLALVAQLQSEGRAPALAKADVGVAMGTGTDVAMNSAQVTLVKGDLRGIAQARVISNQTITNMKQNLAFAFVYNALGVPLAGGQRAVPVHRLAAVADDRGAGDQPQLGVGDRQCAAASRCAPRVCAQRTTLNPFGLTMSKPRGPSD